MSVSREGYASIREVLFSSWQVIAVEIFSIAFWVCMLLSAFGLLSVTPIVIIWCGFGGVVLLSFGIAMVEFLLVKKNSSGR